MWIYLPFGFVSIVAVTHPPGARGVGPGGLPPERRSLLVRARRREHLEGLRRRFPQLTAPIQDTPAADYRYRLVVPRATVAAIVAALVEGIDYGNFKAAAAGSLDATYTEVLHHVWAVTQTLQGPGDRATPAHGFDLFTQEGEE